MGEGMEGMGPLAGVLALGAVAIAVMVLVGLAIAVAVCWFLMTCFQRVPPAHRKQEPGLVWLLLIPCFNLVWSFFVYPRLADSYKSYFDSIGRSDVGDCGRALGLWCCILPLIQLGLSMFSRIPVLGRVTAVLSCVASLAGVVVYIVFLVKAGTLKNQIPEQAA